MGGSDDGVGSAARRGRCGAASATGDFTNGKVRRGKARFKKLAK